MGGSVPTSKQEPQFSPFFERFSGFLSLFLAKKAVLRARHFRDVIRRKEPRCSSPASRAAGTSALPPAG